jgi:hypothetical protein
VIFYVWKDDDFITVDSKKSRDKGKKCHVRAMMYSEVDKPLKMNTRHVPLRQSVEGKRHVNKGCPDDRPED